MSLLRLAEERKKWRKDPPFGFSARPTKNRDGSLNLLLWECLIPGRNDTPWRGGEYCLRMSFKIDYPSSPPDCRFQPPLFHPNVSYRSGKICLSILDKEKDWDPSLSIKEILLAIQELLHNPDLMNVIQISAVNVYNTSLLEYQRSIRHQARLMTPTF